MAPNWREQVKALVRNREEMMQGDVNHVCEAIVSRRYMCDYSNRTNPNLQLKHPKTLTVSAQSFDLSVGTCHTTKFYLHPTLPSQEEPDWSTFPFNKAARIAFDAKVGLNLEGNEEEDEASTSHDLSSTNSQNTTRSNGNPPLLVDIVQEEEPGPSRINYTGSKWKVILFVNKVMIDQYSIACELDDDQLKQLTMKCEDVEIESHILTPSFFISKKFREFLDEISGAYVVNLDDDRNFYEADGYMSDNGNLIIDEDEDADIQKALLADAACNVPYEDNIVEMVKASLEESDDGPDTFIDNELGSLEVSMEDVLLEETFAEDTSMLPESNPPSPRPASNPPSPLPTPPPKSIPKPPQSKKSNKKDAKNFDFTTVAKRGRGAKKAKRLLASERRKKSVQRKKTGDTPKETPVAPAFSYADGTFRESPEADDEEDLLNTLRRSLLNNDSDSEDERSGKSPTSNINSSPPSSAKKRRKQDDEKDNYKASINKVLESAAQSKKGRRNLSAASRRSKRISGRSRRSPSETGSFELQVDDSPAPDLMYVEDEVDESYSNEITFPDERLPDSSRNNMTEEGSVVSKVEAISVTGRTTPSSDSDLDEVQCIAPSRPAPIVIELDDIEDEVVTPIEAPVEESFDPDRVKTDDYDELQIVALQKGRHFEDQAAAMAAEEPEHVPPELAFITNCDWTKIEEDLTDKESPFPPARVYVDPAMFIQLVKNLCLDYKLAYNQLPAYTDRYAIFPNDFMDIFGRYAPVLLALEDIDPTSVICEFNTRLSVPATNLLTRVAGKTQLVTSHMFYQLMEHASQELKKRLQSIITIIKKDERANTLTEADWASLYDHWKTLSDNIMYQLCNSLLNMASATTTKFAENHPSKLRFITLLYGWRSFIRQGGIVRTFFLLSGDLIHEIFRNVVEKYLELYDKILLRGQEFVKMKPLDRVWSFCSSEMTREVFDNIVANSSNVQSDEHPIECKSCKTYFRTQEIHDLHSVVHTISTDCACWADFHHKGCVYIHYLDRHYDDFLDNNAFWIQMWGEEAV